ncbi:MAG: hypothetical protein AAF298_02195 [Cyanobacteria bacterium P01_A01_bin.40]
MNKTQLIALLKDQHEITVSPRKLSKILSYMGVEKTSFSDSDVEDILGAFELLNEHGNQEGYTKIAEKHGVNLNTLSRVGSSEPKDRDSSPIPPKSFAETVKEKVDAEFYNLYDQAVEDFIQSDKPYKMLVNVMNNKAEMYGESMDRFSGSQMKRIDQVTDDTFDITAGDVGGVLPEAPDRDIDDADFHNQDEEG